MTKKEAIKFIEDCSKSGSAPYGFMIVAVSGDDIASNFDTSISDRFFEMKEKKQEKLLSDIAENLKERYEEFEFSEEIQNLLGDIESELEN